MITRRTLLTIPFFIKAIQVTHNNSENLNNALKILNESGFNNTEISRENGREVITLRSTVFQINTNMKAIVEASKTGTLIRCKSEKPEE